MKQEEFGKWLERNGANTENGRSTRKHAVRTIERRLSELGSPAADLEEAWTHDRFEQLAQRLTEIRQNAKDGGQDYRILMPQSEKPVNRLASWKNWLRQYGRFLDGEEPAMSRDADRIRQYVLERYIEPARDNDRAFVDVLVSDVNRALELNQAWPNICQALAGKKFQDLAEVGPPQRIGANMSSATLFRFELAEGGIDRKALENLRLRFLAECPDFKSFLEPGTGWALGEKSYKSIAAQKVKEAMDRETNDAALGQAVYEILKTASEDGPLVRWQTEDNIVRNHPDLIDDFYGVIGEAVRSNQEMPKTLSRSFDELTQLREHGVKELTFGERINILYSALATVRPAESAPVKITLANEAGKLLSGKELFSEKSSTVEEGYQRFAELYGAVFEIMRDDWNWEPKDWLDVQAFLWIALKSGATSLPQTTDYAHDESERSAVSPINLILYGPPGTGKTYATAEEAVRLCGEDVPSDRDELMGVYNRLCEAKRIEFVTFHQSMSYEDFVEGKQPVTGGEGDDTESAGFRLETVPGTFRRICRRAESSRGLTFGSDALSVTGRKVFKTSIGEAANPEDAHLFEEAISGGYTLLGFENIDWSDEKFTERQAIIEACREAAQPEGPLNAQSARVQMPYIFRNWVESGDVIVVSKGNNLFRAIGLVEGNYEFHPRPEGDYAHRRAVRWLWVDREGVPVDEIYERKFSQRTIYILTESELNIPVLERYMNSRQGESAEPESFVLIIDEINRANISKVFGELITLLEPDKRLGALNEIKVRLPYSEDEFGVPANLHIVGTMNTADRSIALLDTALRRRFEFRELEPNPAVLAEAAERSGVDLPKLLATINDRIEYLFDREHRIGHAYFVNCETREEVDAVMRFKIIPLLAEYFFEDLGKVAAVLGDAETHEGPIEGGFLQRAVLKAPPGFSEDDDLAARYRWSVRSVDQGFDYEKLLSQ